MLRYENQALSMNAAFERGTVNNTLPLLKHASLQNGYSYVHSSGTEIVQRCLHGLDSRKIHELTFEKLSPTNELIVAFTSC